MSSTGLAHLVGRDGNREQAVVLTGAPEPLHEVGAGRETLALSTAEGGGARQGRWSGGSGGSAWPGLTQA